MTAQASAPSVPGLRHSARSACRMVSVWYTSTATIFAPRSLRARIAWVITLTCVATAFGPPDDDAVRLGHFARIGAHEATGSGEVAGPRDADADGCEKARIALGVNRADRPRGAAECREQNSSSLRKSHRLERISRAVSGLRFCACRRRPHVHNPWRCKPPKTMAAYRLEINLRVDEARLIRRGHGGRPRLKAGRALARRSYGERCCASGRPCGEYRSNR